MRVKIGSGAIADDHIRYGLPIPADDRSVRSKVIEEIEVLYPHLR